MEKRLNIYEFNWGKDQDYVIAFSEQEAIKAYVRITSCNQDDCKNVISLIKECNWDDYHYLDPDNYGPISFGQFMENYDGFEPFFCSSCF